MKPIEKMAAAYIAESKLWAIGHYEFPGSYVVWRDEEEIAQSSDEELMRRLLLQRRTAASIRAALMALAEAELSEEAIREGNDHATNDQSEFEDTEPVARAFRAILRHLAEEDGR
jgi:hypothetical protein